MWWWFDSGWTVMGMLLILTVCWLVIVAVALGVERVLSARRALKWAKPQLVTSGEMHSSDRSRSAA
jgi:hypothetical protein